MRRTERDLYRQIESLEEKSQFPRADDDDTPLAITLGDDPFEDLPDSESSSGIPTFPTAEAAEEELGEEFWGDPSIKIWDCSDHADESPSD